LWCCRSWYYRYCCRSTLVLDSTQTATSTPSKLTPLPPLPFYSIQNQHLLPQPTNLSYVASFVSTPVCDSTIYRRRRIRSLKEEKANPVSEKKNKKFTNSRSAETPRPAPKCWVGNPVKSRAFWIQRCKRRHEKSGEFRGAEILIPSDPNTNTMDILHPPPSSPPPHPPSRKRTITWPSLSWQLVLNLILQVSSTPSTSSSV
jgi:hypothetical protein